MKSSNNRTDIIVIGGGAAGMTAAVMAARRGKHVMILEHMDAPGRKLLATGNGKCNFANEAQGADKYYGEDPAFVLPVFAQFGLTELIEFFEELGIHPRLKRGGYYPGSGQAASVRTLFLLELQRLDVTIVCNCGIRSVSKVKNGFLIDTKQGEYHATKCILATGGKTMRKSGSDGSGFLYLEALGHHTIDIVPGLVGLKGKQSFFVDIAGIRADAKIDLYINDQYICTQEGELQLTSYGISGIPVFQFSRIAARALTEGKTCRAQIDFMPSMEWAELTDYLAQRMARAAHMTMEQALLGLLPDKLIPVLLECAGVNPSAYVHQQINAASGKADVHCQRIVQSIKALRVDITGWNQFDSAQVTAGGVDTREIDPHTMESRLVPGLYFAGEMVDIDGICGGYNLQWAWASGAVAGTHAAIHEERL